jgi:uncharacterized phiE125 gp8 family phage protein
MEMAYVALTDLKAWLNVDSTAHDALLQSCLDAAQSYIEDQTGRTFEAASTASTRYMDAVGDVDGPTLLLGADLCAITSVTNGDGAAVSTAAYVTEPRNGTPFYAIKLKPSAGLSWTYTTDPENAIAVSGKWSYSATPPADVAHAAKIIAAQMYQQKDNAADADRLVSADGVIIVPSSIPKVAADVIRKYQRRTF